MTRRWLCWLLGCGMHHVDLLAAAYGGRWVCTRCGKDCGYSSLEVGRP